MRNGLAQKLVSIGECVDGESLVELRVGSLVEAQVGLLAAPRVEPLPERE